MSPTSSSDSDSDPFVEPSTTRNNNNNSDNNSGNNEQPPPASQHSPPESPPSTPPLTPPRSPLRLLTSISETTKTKDADDEQASKDAAAEAGMTSLPLRVPAKSARRNNQQMPPPPAYGLGNGNGDSNGNGAVSRTGSDHSSNTSHGYGYAASASSAGGAFGSGPYPNGVHPSVPVPGVGGGGAFVQQQQQQQQDATMSSLGSKEGKYAGTDGSEADPKEFNLLKRFGIDEGNWSSDRRRRCRFLTVVILVILIIVGITVGLGVGLTQGNSNRTTAPDSDPDSGSSTPKFPSGSYTLNTTLQTQSTACTSRPSTWRCFPYTAGQSADFYWTIAPSASNQGSYTVSSSDNPFAPAFANISLTLADQGRDTEHYYFSFNMNRTIVPSDALTPTDRAASCTYDNTQFLATLWTRRHGGQALSSPPGDGGVKFSQWPGDVEVAQVAQSHTGEPRCVDSSGAYIADVQAGSGQCQCQYASFDVSKAGSLSGLLS